MQVFSKTWFQKYQSRLLWFANTFVGRRILGIEEKGRVVEVLPNCYTVCSGDVFKTDIRTHEKFGKRLYYRLKYVWHAIHWFDMLFANRFAPQLNFGFDTTTVYPDANPESTSVDGYTRETGSQTWGSIQAGAGDTSNDSSATGDCVWISSSTTSNEWDRLSRSIFLFDTSSIDDTDYLEDATVSIRGTGKGSENFGAKVALYASNPASNTALVNADFTTLGTTKLSDTEYTNSTYDDSAYNDFSLNASGLSAIDFTGVSKFGCRDSVYDVPDVEPTWQSGADDFFSCAFADQGGTSQDPKLVITHFDPIPEVNTDGTKEIFETTGTGQGNVVKDRGAAVTERGVVVDTSTDPEITDTKFTTSGTTGTYETSMTSLSANTGYYMRAFATNSNGTGYGANVQFTTDEDTSKPIIQLDNPITFS